MCCLRFSTVHSVDLPVIRGRSLFVVVMTAHLVVVSTSRVNERKAQPLNVLQRFSTTVHSVDLPVIRGRSLFVMTAHLVVVSTSRVNERKAQPLNVLQRFSTVDLPVTI